MKAAQIDRFGGPEVFSIVEIPRPEPAPGQVLVKTAACGVNFAETSLRQNNFLVTPSLPTILGSEVVGTVEKLGEGVDGIRVGDRVVAALFVDGTRNGGYAEYTVAKQDFVLPIPDDISFEDACAVTVQGLTGHYITTVHPPRDRRVLVTAAAGGVGGMLVQFARLHGAHTIIGAVGSEARFGAVKELGASDVVNYNEPGWADALRAATGGLGPDLVYDSVGGEVFDTNLAMLSEHGKLVFYGSNNLKGDSISSDQMRMMNLRNLTVASFGIQGQLSRERLRSGLTEIFSLLREGSIRPRIAGRYPLEEVGEAHRALEARSTLGKVLLIP
ncbi:quinone oxidoreductase family protein [Streptomyces mirabilis]|uniref:quinone oxidoreductase family protein n=1 Tax=Streptomyces mirabilis TaxID=68239 RepID=UPI0036B4E3D9